MNLSKHASKRYQQRGFSIEDAELLQIYGKHRISMVVMFIILPNHF